MRERLHKSFNGKLRDELFDQEVFVFATLEEAQGLVNIWRKRYGHIRPYS